MKRNVQPRSGFVNSHLFLVLSMLVLSGCLVPTDTKPASCESTGVSCAQNTNSTTTMDCIGKTNSACLERIGAQSCAVGATIENQIELGPLPGIPGQAKQDQDWYVLSNAAPNGTIFLALLKDSGVRVTQFAGHSDFLLDNGVVLFGNPAGRLALWNLKENSTQWLPFTGYRPFGLEGPFILLQSPNNNASFTVFDRRTNSSKAIDLSSLADWGPGTELVNATFVGGRARFATFEWRTESENGVRISVPRNQFYDIAAPFEAGNVSVSIPGGQRLALNNEAVVLLGGGVPTIYRMPTPYRAGQIIRFSKYEQSASARRLVHPIREVNAQSVIGGHLTLIEVRREAGLDVLAWDSQNVCYRQFLNETNSIATSFALSPSGELAYLTGTTDNFGLVRILPDEPPI